MNGIPVCKICLEPISNFVCPDCIYRAIQQWIWKYEPGLIGKFRDFHITFIETVVSEKTTFCVVCKREYYHMVCFYDYAKEAYAWLEEQGLSEERLLEFLRIFSMGFREIESHG